MQFVFSWFCLPAALVAAPLSFIFFFRAPVKMVPTLRPRHKSSLRANLSAEDWLPFESRQRNRNGRFHVDISILIDTEPVVATAVFIYLLRLHNEIVDYFDSADYLLPRLLRPLVRPLSGRRVSRSS